MSSAPILEAPPAPVAAETTIPSLPKEETSDDPFGAILEEATDDNAPTPPEEKKKEEPTVVAPLYYFCPPPSIDVPPLAVVSQTSVQPIEVPELAASVAQSVAPKPTEDPPDPDSKRIELDPKLFQPILPEAAPPNPPLSKAPDFQRPPVTTATHGTLVAQLENRVKNSEKSAEIAPAPEQKMPVREELRRAVAEISRVESFHADKPSPQLLSADFASELRETIPVKSLQAAHLVETIRSEVATLRQRNDTTMTVTLRPDSGTQLSLDLTIARDGSVHAQARCERGDFHALQAQWPQLQQSLAAHGIRIADLSNQNGAQQQNHRAPDSFQNFSGQNQNQNQQRADREGPSFEEQFSGAKQKSPSINKPQPQPAARAATPRQWQSWA